MRKAKRILLLLVISFAWVFGFIPASSHADHCGPEQDWQSIYILPTNGDHDKNIKIDLSVNKTRVKPGDPVTIKFRADKDCYLTLMNVGTSGRIFRLWPNKYAGENNYLAANTSKEFPSSTDQFRYRIAKPEGIEKIIAYATSEKEKILSEEEFYALKRTGFKEFTGTPKDLAKKFGIGTFSPDTNLHWGTAQVNLCIREKEKEQRRQSQEESSTGSSTPPESNDDRETTRTRPREKGTTYLLAIGVPTGRLKYCHVDARNVARVLKSRYRGGRLKVKTLLKSEASYRGVEKSIQWLIRETKPEDCAIIFFSGHGTSVPDVAPLDETDGRDECFVLHHEGKLRDYKKALAQKKLMRDDDFNKLLKRIPARKKIVIADACHSGSISKSIGLKEQRLVSKYYPLSEPETGKELRMASSKAVAIDYGNDHEAIIAACLDNQASYEDPKRASGLFTFHLLKAIKGGSPDLKAAFRKARRATRKETESYARQLRDRLKAQTPTLTDPHGLVGSFKF
ncbi:caspase family protein [Thermodesulfobacteriota bacterium]